MIKNEKQYRISKRKLKELNNIIEKVKNDKDPEPLKIQLTLASMGNLKKQLETDLNTYEVLKRSKEGLLKERYLKELPSLITEYKIMSGLTQKQLSEILGLKEQQLQRYEADNFKGVSFTNLVKFLELIGLEIKINEVRVTKYRGKTSEH